MDESDDDTPQLSAHALQALQEFYTEQSSHATEDGENSTMKEMPTEDWVSFNI